MPYVKRFSGRDRRLFVNKAISELVMGCPDQAKLTCDAYIKPVKTMMNRLYAAEKAMEFARNQTNSAMKSSFEKKKYSVNKHDSSNGSINLRIDLKRSSTQNASREPTPEMTKSHTQHHRVPTPENLLEMSLGSSKNLEEQ